MGIIDPLAHRFSIVTRTGRAAREAAFWDKTKMVDSGCLEWQGRIQPERRGYGSVRFEGRSEKAHRVAWMITHGAIPAGLCVCHTCDNPACVNPGHLWLGTRLDNMRDMTSKGRAARISRPYCGRKLTYETAEEIRAKDSAGESRLRLAEIYGVSYSTIRNIVFRSSYRDPVSRHKYMGAK